MKSGYKQFKQSYTFAFIVSESSDSCHAAKDRVQIPG